MHMLDLRTQRCGFTLRCVVSILYASWFSIDENIDKTHRWVAAASCLRYCTITSYHVMLIFFCEVVLKCTNKYYCIVQTHRMAAASCLSLAIHASQCTLRTSWKESVVKQRVHKKKKGCEGRKKKGMITWRVVDAVLRVFKRCVWGRQWDDQSRWRGNRTCDLHAPSISINPRSISVDLGTESYIRAILWHSNHKSFVLEKIKIKRGLHGATDSGSSKG